MRVLRTILIFLLRGTLAGSCLCFVSPLGLFRPQGTPVIRLAENVDRKALPCMRFHGREKGHLEYSKATVFA